MHMYYKMLQYNIKRIHVYIVMYFYFDIHVTVVRLNYHDCIG